MYRSTDELKKCIICIKTFYQFEICFTLKDVPPIAFLVFSAMVYSSTKRLTSRYDFFPKLWLTQAISILCTILVQNSAGKRDPHSLFLPEKYLESNYGFCPLSIVFSTLETFLEKRYSKVIIQTWEVFSAFFFSRNFSVKNVTLLLSSCYDKALNANKILKYFWLLTLKSLADTLEKVSLVVAFQKFTRNTFVEFKQNSWDKG